jgi:hypothetical protein
MPPIWLSRSVLKSFRDVQQFGRTEVAVGPSHITNVTNLALHILHFPSMDIVAQSNGDLVVRGLAVISPDITFTGKLKFNKQYQRIEIDFTESPLAFYWNGRRASALIVYLHGSPEYGATYRNARNEVTFISYGENVITRSVNINFAELGAADEPPFGSYLNELWPIGQTDLGWSVRISAGNHWGNHQPIYEETHAIPSGELTRANIPRNPIRHDYEFDADDDDDINLDIPRIQRGLAPGEEAEVGITMKSGETIPIKAGLSNPPRVATEQPPQPKVKEDIDPFRVSRWSTVPLEGIKPQPRRKENNSPPESEGFQKCHHHIEQVADHLEEETM